MICTIKEKTRFGLNPAGISKRRDIQKKGYPKERMEQEIKIVTQNIIRKYLWGIKLSKDI